MAYSKAQNLCCVELWWLYLPLLPRKAAQVMPVAASSQLCICIKHMHSQTVLQYTVVSCVQDQHV